MTSPFLYVSGDVAVPEGSAGELSIVVVGQPQEASVPVVVRNRTSEPIGQVQVAGPARDDDGTLIGSGSSQTIAPSVVQPGEWAFGYVYFDLDSLPKQAEFDLSVSGDPVQPGDPFSTVDLPIEEATHGTGDYSDRVVGITANDTGADVEGPLSVSVACFDGSEILHTWSGFADVDALPACGTASFTVDIFEDSCPAWVVGSSGYTY